MDKPNMHRLLELYVHSIPALGHVRHFSEVIFEKAHQPFKRAIQESNHRLGNVQAVEHSLMNDWRERLCASISDKTSKATASSREYDTISSLLIGNLSKTFTQDGGMEFALRSIVDDMLIPAIAQQTGREQSCSNICAVNGARWSASQKKSGNDAVQYKEHLRTITQCLCVEHEQDIQFYNVATLQRRRGESSSHHRIYCGNVVQAIVRFNPDEPVIDHIDSCLDTSHTDDYSIGLFLVKGTFEVTCAAEDSRTRGVQRACPEKSLYVLAKKCVYLEEKYVTIDCTYQNLVYILALSEHVRRVGMLHACFRALGSGSKHANPSTSSQQSMQNGECVFEEIAGSAVVHHAKLNIEEGGVFHVFTTRTGYPPRMG